MIVEPLIACKNTVDVVVSTCGSFFELNCTNAVHQLLNRTFGDVLLASEVDCRTSDQGEAARRAIDLLVDHADGRRAGRGDAPREAFARLLAQRYSLVIFTRMDLAFVRPITLWRHANFSQFLFFSQCPAWWGATEANCVADSLHVMSGADLVRWEPFVGPFSPFAGCFWPHWANPPLTSYTWGHFCYNLTARAIGRLPGLVLPPSEWRPRAAVREPNPIAHFISCPVHLNRSQCRHQAEKHDGLAGAGSLNKVPPQQLRVAEVNRTKWERFRREATHANDSLLLRVLRRREADVEQLRQLISLGGHTYRGQ